METNQKLLKKVQAVLEKGEKFVKTQTNINLEPSKSRVGVQIDWAQGRIAISQ